MLKKEYDTLYTTFRNWLFEKYSQFGISRMYGAKEPMQISKDTAFMQMKVLSFVKSANDRRNPDSRLLIPAGIDSNDFNMMISNIKNNLR